MAKKGQVLVFENVLIFTAGVAIFILSYAVFMVYQNYFTAVGVEDQLGAVNEYVKSYVVLIAENDANATVTFKIPKEVGNEHYTIELTPDGVNTTSLSTGVSSFSTMNLGMQARGKVPSTRGKITLKKEGNKIIMRI